MLKNQRFRIAAIVCSYNNQDGLEKLVTALLSQTYALAEIIIVDNSCSEKIQQNIKTKFPDVTFLCNQTNLGVGGAYERGMRFAYEKQYHWVWLFDDDSVPSQTGLEELINAFQSVGEIERVGIMASLPVDVSTGMKYAGDYWRGRFVRSPKELAESTKPFFVDSVISSGSLVNMKIVEEVGFPRADFFIDYVDHEYNLRIRRKNYVIIRVPSSVLYHKLGKGVRLGDGLLAKTIKRLLKKDFIIVHPPWRLYYKIRNELYMYLYEVRSWKGLLSVMKAVLYNLFVPFSEEGERIKYMFLGLKDGVGGKLGKLVEPR